jgi:hypothetical protein
MPTRHLERYGLWYYVFRFYKLVIKNVQERCEQLRLFFMHLITRGYSPTFVWPIFFDTQDYIKNRCHLLTQPTQAEKTNKPVSKHSCTSSSPCCKILDLAKSKSSFDWLCSPCLMRPFFVFYQPSWSLLILVTA